MQIRKTEYRGRSGFIICGKDKWQRSVSVFVVTREGAERIRQAYKTLGTTDEVSRVIGDVFDSEKAVR